MFVQSHIQRNRHHHHHHHQQHHHHHHQQHQTTLDSHQSSADQHHHQQHGRIGKCSSVSVVSSCSNSSSLNKQPLTSLRSQPGDLDRDRELAESEKLAKRRKSLRSSRKEFSFEVEDDQNQRQSALLEPQNNDKYSREEESIFNLIEDQLATLVEHQPVVSQVRVIKQAQQEVIKPPPVPVRLDSEETGSAAAGAAAAASTKAPLIATEVRGFNRFRNLIGLDHLSSVLGLFYNNYFGSQTIVIKPIVSAFLESFVLYQLETLNLLLRSNQDQEMYHHHFHHHNHNQLQHQHSNNLGLYCQPHQQYPLVSQASIERRQFAMTKSCPTRPTIGGDPRTPSPQQQRITRQQLQLRTQTSLYDADESLNEDLINQFLSNISQGSGQSINTLSAGTSKAQTGHLSRVSNRSFNCSSPRVMSGRLRQQQSCSLDQGGQADQLKSRLNSYDHEPSSGLHYRNQMRLELSNEQPVIEATRISDFQSKLLSINDSNRNGDRSGETKSKTVASDSELYANMKDKRRNYNSLEHLEQKRLEIEQRRRRQLDREQSSPAGSGSHQTGYAKSGRAGNFLISPGKISLSGAKRRFGFIKSNKSGLSSLSVQRSEEVLPQELCNKTQFKSATTNGLRFPNANLSASFNQSTSDSGNESGLSPSRLRFCNVNNWLNPLDMNPDDPRASFVDGLGVGQIASRQALVSPYLGDVQLTISDQRGIGLEVEVVRARQLQIKPTAKLLPCKCSIG